MSVEEHRKRAVKNVKCAVITVSDSRTKENDESGKIIIDNLEKSGHSVKKYNIVRDDKDQIQEILRECIEDKEVSAIILSGGTGASSRDLTIGAIESFSEKPLPGFGEIFRALSYDEIGAAAMLSRAEAFVSENKVIFALPGSTAAAKLAIEKLIVPELGHLISEIRR